MVIRPRQFLSFVSPPFFGNSLIGAFRPFSSTPFSEAYAKQRQPKSEKKPASFGRMFTYAVLGSTAFYTLYSYGAPDESSTGSDGITSRMIRAVSRLRAFFASFNEPTLEKLLPEPYKGPNAKPYTLVIDLDKFLVCHIWDPEMGKWRIAKRPGVDMFLFYMAHMYEIVVYSKLSQFEAENVMEKLDPFRLITFRLYRFATRYMDGQYKKDITRLNRDLSKVIVMGHDASYLDHPEDFIQVAPWDGDDQDRVLLNSIDFLETLAMSDIPDLRKVIQAYRSEGYQDILAEFEKRQKEAYESVRQSRLQSEHSLFKRVLNYLFMGGVSPNASPQSAEASPESPAFVPPSGLVPFEEHREEINKQRKKIYDLEIKRIEKEVKQQTEATKAYLAQNKSSVFDMFTKGPPPPPMVDSASKS
jgi:import inner membrane translocase subunit TIM50